MPEEIGELKHARKEARVADLAKFEQDMAGEATEDEANYGIPPPLEAPVFVPEPDPPSDSEQERGAWEGKDVPA